MRNDFAEKMAQNVFIIFLQRCLLKLVLKETKLDFNYLMALYFK